MEGPEDGIEAAGFSLCVVLGEVTQVTPLKVAGHPVTLGDIAQDAVAIEDTVLELSHVEVAVLIPLLAEPVQLRVAHVSPLQYFELEVVLSAVCFWVVPSVTPSKHQS